MSLTPPSSPLLNRLIAVLAWLGLALAAAGAVTAALAGLGHRWDWWPFHTGFALLRWGAYGGIIGAAFGALALLPAVVSRRWLSLGAAAVGLVLGLAVAGVPWSHLQQARTVPAIHDITTDTENPPQFEAVLPLRRNAPNSAEYPGESVAARQREGYPGLGPARLDLPPARVFPAVEGAAREMGWRVVAAEPARGRLEATATTFWFGFKDDVVVRLTPLEDGGGTRVDVRSVSRVGVSDVGKNAARIRAFLDALAARLPGDAS